MGRKQADKKGPQNPKETINPKKKKKNPESTQTLVDQGKKKRKIGREKTQ